MAAAPLERAGRSLPFISGRESPRAADCASGRRRPRRRLRRPGASAPSCAIRKSKADDVRTPGGAAQPVRPNYERCAPCPRPGRLPRAAPPQVGRTPGISCEGRDLRRRFTARATPWRLPPTTPRSSSNRPSSASSPCCAAALALPACRHQPTRTAPDRTPESRQVPRPLDPVGRGTARLIRPARRHGCGAPGKTRSRLPFK